MTFDVNKSIFAGNFRESDKLAFSANSGYTVLSTWKIRFIRAVVSIAKYFSKASVTLLSPFRPLLFRDET